jgi:hypothetical protein
MFTIALGQTLGIDEYCLGLLVVHVLAITQYLNSSFVCSFIRTQRLLRCSASMEILLECMIQPQVISTVKVRKLKFTVSFF